MLLVAGGFWLAQNRGPTAPEGAGSQVPVADSQGAETSEQPEVPVPEGYELVPFLVEEPVGAFEEAEFVLEEGLDYAAVIETSKGRLVIDLHQDEVPRDRQQLRLPRPQPLLRRHRLPPRPRRLHGPDR